MIMAGAHVAHNCQLADDVIMANAVLLAGYVEVGTRAFVSGGVVVHQFARIGECAMIQGNARVSQDVPPFMLADHSGHVVNINVVGLRRAGFSGEELEEIHRAHRLLYRRHASFRTGVSELARTIHTEAGRRLLQFVRVESRRGFAPRAHRARGLPAAAPGMEVAREDPKAIAYPTRRLRITGKPR
jgi:UDP-N-acetylglucosamine acyltransferase